MDNQIKVWLFDILQSIEEIESYFPKGEKKIEFLLQFNCLDEFLFVFIKKVKNYTFPKLSPNFAALADIAY